MQNEIIHRDRVATMYIISQGLPKSIVYDFKFDRVRIYFKLYTQKILDNKKNFYRSRSL